MSDPTDISANEIVDLTASATKMGTKRKRTASSEKPEQIVDLTADSEPEAAIQEKKTNAKKKKKKKKGLAGQEEAPAVQPEATAANRKLESVTPANAHPLWVALLNKYSRQQDPEYQLVCFEYGSTMEDWRRIITLDPGLVVCPKYDGDDETDDTSALVQVESLCSSLVVPFVKAPLDIFTPFINDISDTLGTIDTSRLVGICLRKVMTGDSYQLECIQNIVLADPLRRWAITPALATILKEIRTLDRNGSSADAALDNGDSRQSALIVGFENVQNAVMHGRPYLVLAMRPKRVPKNLMVTILRHCARGGIPFVLYTKAHFMKKQLEMLSNSDAIIACIVDGPPRYAQVIQSLVDEIQKATTRDATKDDEPDVRLSTPEVENGINSEIKPNDDAGPPIPEKIDLLETASEFGSTTGRSQAQTDASTVGLLESEIEALRLEERIYLLEAMLKNIADRRKLLQQEQDTAVVDFRQKEERVVQLVGKKKELILTLGRKRKLQQQMSKLLQKAEHRLQTLTTAVDISLDELAEFVGSESTASVNRDTSKTFSYSSSSSVQEAKNATQQHRPGHTLHLAGVTFDRLRILWMSKRDPSYRLGTFGSVLSTKEKIKSFLHINAMETLAIDKVTNGWRWRRESMWNTCLDVRLIISEHWHSEDAVDDHHTEDSAGTTSDRIDPYIPICPYEISGECQDEFCAYQHLQPRSFGRVLPREFLPLPHLLLSLVEEAEEEFQNPEIQSFRKESYRKGSSSKSSAPPVQETVEEDFIRLPEVLLSSSDTANSGFEDYALLPVLEKYSIANKADKAWLSRKQMEKTTKDNVSFKKLLESGEFYLDEQQESIFIALEPVKTPVEIVLFLIRLTKLVRVSIHAGRFDVSRAVLDFASDWSEKLESDSTSMGEMSVKLLRLIVSILNTLELKAFGLETEPSDSVFQVAYRTQEHLAIVCCFLEFMLPRLGDENTATFFRHLTEQESALADIGHIEGDGPLDRLSSYFVPLATGDGNGNGVQCLEFLPEFISHMTKTRQLRLDVLAIKSPSKIVADVIKPSLRWFEQFVERSLRLGQSTKDILLKGVMLISQLVKGAIEAAAIQLQRDLHVEIVRNQMIDIWVAVDKLLFSIQKSCSFFPSLEFLLTPVLAANVALGTTLCAYDRVIVRLEKFLGGYVPSPLSILSEILWSQLLQLEASLPKRTDRIVSVKGVYQLPLDVEELHELLALLITSFGVRPHHVVLANDWNLTSVIMDEPTEDNARLFQSIHERLVEDNLPQIEFKMSDRGLKSQESRGPSAGVISPIPHSLLVIGTSLSKLSLTRTSLKLLPDQFGVYFSCLESLDLSDNDLEEIPQSTFLIKTLKSMSVSRNNLTCLPNTVDLPVLSLFAAEDNKIRELPASFLYCSELERLCLRGNPLEKSVWTLAAQLPKLFEFTST